jgi:hypothetical protein
MALIKTVAGIIVLEECDAIDDWTLYGPAVEGGIDSDHVSGTHSFYVKGHGTGNHYNWLYKNLDIGNTSGRKVRIWGKNDRVFFDNWILRIGSYSLPSSTTYYPNWTLLKGTIPDNITGIQEVRLAVIWLVQNESYETVKTDLLLIYSSDFVTISGVLPGQKVELYRKTGDVLIGSGTCASDETSVSINVSAESFPESMYAKIYATDGITLIETTNNPIMCGGDTFLWAPQGSTLLLTSDNFVIYRQGVSETPQAAEITATLYKNDMVTPYPGQTIYFSSLLGTLSAPSAVTDANGQAKVSITSTDYGLAVVEGTWLGDAESTAGVGFTAVHIFYDVEAGDSNKDFQFYCEGKEYEYGGPEGTSPGSYGLNNEMITENFNVQLCEYPTDIVYNGLVTIYRKGVKEFAGVMKNTEQTLVGLSVIVSGVDISNLLETVTVGTEPYSAQTPEYMINDLLTKYPCGITPGNLATYIGAPFDLFVNYESLGSAIRRICNMVGYYFRVNLDRTLDFAQQFGSGLAPVAFTEGVDILDARNTEGV